VKELSGNANTKTFNLVADTRFSFELLEGKPGSDLGFLSNDVPGKKSLRYPSNAHQIFIPEQALHLNKSKLTIPVVFQALSRNISLCFPV
jgi:hypothetical protein